MPKEQSMAEVTRIFQSMEEGACDFGRPEVMEIVADARDRTLSCATRRDP